MSKKAPAVSRPELSNWFNLYCNVFGETGLRVLAWWTGTMFARNIYRDYGYWPVLYLTSQPGAGKSSMIQFLWKLLGRENYEGFCPRYSTTAGRFRSYFEVKNIPVVVLNPWSADDLREIATLYNGRTARAVMKKGEFGVLESEFYGGVMIVDADFTQNVTRVVDDRLCELYMSREHQSQDGFSYARVLRRMTVEELAPFQDFIYENYDFIYKSFCDILDAKIKKIEFKGNYTQTVLNAAMLDSWFQTIHACILPDYRSQGME